MPSLSYITQFERTPTRYATAAIAKKVHSKRAIDRRLVLPLESNNWIRALEVLQSRYAKDGLSPLHYQEVLRNYVANASPHNYRDMIPVIDAIRDQVFAEDLPSSPSLWFTLVSAYLSMNATLLALETAEQAMERHDLSMQAKQQLAEVLLPPLAAEGRLQEAKFVHDVFLTSFAQRSPSIRKLMMEVHATSGHSWVAALRHAASLTSSPAAVSSSSPSSPDRSGLMGDDADNMMSPSAMAGLVESMALDGQWSHALRYFQSLRHRASSAASSAVVTPALQRLVMNAVAQAGQWGTAVAFWQQEFARCATETDMVLLRLMLCSLPVQATPLAALPIDSKPDTPPTAVLPLQSANPDFVVKVFNMLCTEREDWELDNEVGSVVVGALVQTGQWDRALHVLRSCPMMQGRVRKSQPPQGPSSSSSSRNEDDRVATQNLAALVYHLHRGYSAEATLFTLKRFPFAFPKSVFPTLPVPVQRCLQGKGSDAAALCALRGDSTTNLSESSAYNGCATEIDPAEALPDAASRVLPSARRFGVPGKPRSTVASAAEVDQAMQRQMVRFEKNKWRLTFEADANRDPRPAPIGLHDTANGWSFLQRGGEKVFSNSKKTAHLLETQPKNMRALKNPLRGWNPKQNSSLAHLDAVRKWNGNSAL